MVLNTASDTMPASNGKPGSLYAGGSRALKASFKDLGSLESVQATLDSRNASDDLLEFWAEEEEKFFASSTIFRKQGLEENARKTCALFMANQMVSEFPERYWFDALLILDAYTTLSPTLVEVAELPALCEAILGLVWKFDDAMASTTDMCYARCMNHALWLRAAGYMIDSPVLTQKSVDVAELRVLGALKWRMPKATVESWMSAFCARICALTGQRHMETLLAIYQQCLPIARELLANVASTATLSPQHVARGLFAMGCVAGRVIPPELLGFDSHETFHDVFFAVPINVAKAEHVPFMLDLLEFACRCSFSCLTEDCAKVASCIRKMLLARDAGCSKAAEEVEDFNSVGASIGRQLEPPKRNAFNYCSV